MTSSPPVEHFADGLGLIAMRAHTNADLGGAVCFAVEGAPAQCCSSEPEPLGRLRMRTELAGRVVYVDDSAFEVAHQTHRVRVRYLLPQAVDLTSLLGHRIALTVVLHLDPTRAPTVDATIRSTDGRLLLWARDGALPSDRAARPQVRVTHSDTSGRRLAFNLPRGLASLRPGERVEVAGETRITSLCAVRVADDEAAFVLVAG